METCLPYKTPFYTLWPDHRDIGRLVYIHRLNNVVVAHRLPRRVYGQRLLILVPVSNASRACCISRQGAPWGDYLCGGISCASGVSVSVGVTMAVAVRDGVTVGVWLALLVGLLKSICIVAVCLASNVAFCTALAVLVALILAALVPEIAENARPAMITMPAKAPPMKRGRRPPCHTATCRRVTGTATPLTESLKAFVSSPAVENRSSGSFASALKTTLSTAAGNSGLVLRTLGGVS